MTELGRLLITISVATGILGLLMLVGAKIPFLGKLPGDIYIERGNATFYFPVVSSIIISLVLTAVIRIINR